MSADSQKGESFSFPESEAVLQLFQAANARLIVVCGQAVNFWAERYSADDSSLLDYRPFTSHDLDVLGSLEDAYRIAYAEGIDVDKSPKGAASPVAANLNIKAGTKIRLVQFLSTVSGVKNSDIIEFAVPFEGAGGTVQIADPITTLEGKIHNFITLAQKGRNDENHIEILTRCIPIFLAKQIQAIADEPEHARLGIAALERIIDLSMTMQSLALQEKFKINWPALLPMRELGQIDNARIKNFLEKRVPRWTKKLQVLHESI